VDEIKAKSNRGGVRVGAGRKPKDPQARSFEETAPTYNRPQVYLTSIEAKNELPAWDRMKLLKSARWLLNNSGLAQRIVRGISRYSVGSGLVPQARTSDREWNKRAEQLFEDRVATDAFAFDKSAAVNFYEAQRMIVEQMVTDGEMFAQLDKSETGNAMARFITAEYVGNQSNDDAQSGFHDGIKVNSDNKPVVYRVLSNPTRQDVGYTDVPAADMIHIRKLHRYGFLRGVSWLCSAVSRIQD
jgi:capsid protein